jgi:dipicolinate synthase subunit A
MTLDLRGRVVAVLGGDGREVEIARQATLAGAEVRAFGLSAAAVAGTRAAAAVSMQQAIRDADIVICPIPLPAADGSLFAPQSAEKLLPTVEVLRGMRRGGILITGRASAQMHEAARVLELRLHEYEADEELMLRRAPAIAEGAIRIAIEHTDVTLHRNPCMVVGFGKIAPTIASMLRGLGADVTVAARNPVQRARAWAARCETVPVSALAEHARRMAVVFNTVPARLFTRDVIRQLGEETVLIDLAAPPGGVDQDAARELGVRSIWARGLGGRAPRTVGQSQWSGIARIITEEASRGSGEGGEHS